MEKTIWAVNPRSVTVNFNGTHEEFQKMVYLMLSESSELAGMITAMVVRFWQDDAAIDCGKLGELVTTDDKKSEIHGTTNG